MKPNKTTIGVFVFDAVLLVLLVLVCAGCITINGNINILGKQIPNLSIDTPYKTVAPWIDAGGDVTAEAGGTDVGGADVMVPLSPPEMDWPAGPIQDIEVPR
ncbi:MAG: hypothetical protein OEQ39_19035 [Gammaproteobacteria bacterium]|nr:hypothetical protein [Gammaproteobacteria bacterium]